MIEVVEDEALELDETDCHVKPASAGQTEKEQQKERQERAMAELTKFAHRVQEAMSKQQASERRAQFAASGSTEVLRPKKTARKSSK